LGQPWTEVEVVGFLRRILPLLDVAHRRGITHRDIKPANIFIMGSDVRAPGTPCKLLDLGLERPFPKAR
jgi:serine/threonine protein kinase